MISKRKVSAAGESVTGAKNSKSAKGLASSVYKQRPQPDTDPVTPKSGQVISRNVATHRDALKRLADR